MTKKNMKNKISKNLKNIIILLALLVLLSFGIIDIEDVYEHILDNYGTNYQVLIDEEFARDLGKSDFTEEDLDLSQGHWQDFTPLDRLNRVGPANAMLHKDLMPTEKRESIQDVKPTGFRNKKYEFVEGEWLYNRCHLIGYQLTGENDNWLNLMTGTRSFNAKGMLPYENIVAKYLRETNNHVRYRVTPYFDGQDLLARGVTMEAKSVEDKGDAIDFKVYVSNHEPGVEIDYGTGRNRKAK